MFLSQPLPAGTPAPGFTLPDQSGRLVTLADLAGKNVVLIFYPGDGTPTCTRQLCAFRDAWAEAAAHNTLVFGVNPWSARRHARFRDQHRLPFPLLVDAGQRVGALYRTRGLFVRRTVYVIGPDGIIRYARCGHPAPAEVLASARPA